MDEITEAKIEEQMNIAWEAWHGGIDDIPAPAISFKKGFFEGFKVALALVVEGIESD